jgi:hypothetical protein
VSDNTAAAHRRAAAQAAAKQRSNGHRDDREGQEKCGHKENTLDINWDPLIVFWNVRSLLILIGL